MFKIDCYYTCLLAYKKKYFNELEIGFKIDCLAVVAFNIAIHINEGVPEFNYGVYIRR